MRTFAALILRIALFMPLALLAALFGAIGSFFERMSDGLNDIARATRQITEAPYVREYARLIAEAEEGDRLELLRRIEASLK